MSTIASTVEKLCKASRKDYINPYSYLEWPEQVEAEQWFTSPALTSLHGTELYDNLSDAQRKVLSFHEAVNFFSLNIHGEKALIEGLAHRLYKRGTQEISPYLHHFLDEENKHMIYFGEFCMRYAGKVYPDRKMTLPRDYAPGEEDFLFFAKVMIFEEIVDVYNVQMSLDESLVPIARQINLMHHRDEARHLVFGRQLVKELFDHFSRQWSPEILDSVREYLTSYLISTWKEYYNPDVYRDAGIRDPYEVQELAFNHPRCREHRRRISRACVTYLVDNKILLEVPDV